MTNPNDSAFPEVQDVPQFNHHSYGLTKREYFAVLALQGLNANNDSRRTLTIAMLVDLSVMHADALIEELNKEKP